MRETADNWCSRRARFGGIRPALSGSGRAAARLDSEQFRSTPRTGPPAARAQQAGAMPRIGLLSVFAESDPEGQALIKELMQGLQELGWVNGRNVRIDFRFDGVDEAHISTLATELIE